MNDEDRIVFEAWAETKRCAKENTAIMITTANKAELSAETAISIANKATAKAKVAVDLEALIIAAIDDKIADNTKMYTKLWGCYTYCIECAKDPG